MKTKFILHGGCSSRKTPANRKFFLEILSSTSLERIKILCIYFARPKHRWEIVFERDKEIFLSLDSKKKLSFEMATSDNALLARQITNSDVIFIAGGRKGFLRKKLSELGNFQDLIKGKIVVGISAGTSTLSTYFYSNVAKKIRHGLGVLPIKTFCHFSEDKKRELELLREYRENLKVYKLLEEKFSIIEINN